MPSSRTRIQHHHIDWWLQRLEGVEKKSDGYVSLCPSHNDRRPSLHLTLKEGERVPIIHCFAGCGWVEILKAAQSRDPHSNGNGVDPKVVTIGSHQSPLDQWAAYTGVPRSYWEMLGVQTLDRNIVFTWPWIRNVKTRNPWGKNISWQPGKPPFIPLWPEPMQEADLSSIVLCEGERDCGVLRYLGIEAFTLGSASVELETVVIDGLRRRGVENVTVLYDADQAGRSGAWMRIRELRAAGINAWGVDISPLIQTHPDGWTHEKDIGDLYLRLNGELKEKLTYLPELEEVTPIGPWDLYINSAPENVPWIVSPLVSRGSVTLLSGSPKAGKTTFVLKLLREMSSGGEFLGHAVEPARVLYLTESPPVALRQQSTAILGDLTAHLSVVSRFDQLLIDVGWDSTFKALGDLSPYDLIVVDTLAAWARMEDENDASEAYRALRPIRLTAQREGIGVVVVHHLGKSGESPRGSTAFQAEVDTLLHLTGEGTGPRHLGIKTTLLPRTPEPIDFGMGDDGNYVLVSPQAVSGDDYQSILDVFDGEAWLTVKDVISSLGLEYEENWNSITYRLKKLVENGQLNMDKKPGRAMLFKAVPSIKITRRRDDDDHDDDV